MYLTSQLKDVVSLRLWCLYEDIKDTKDAQRRPCHFPDAADFLPHRPGLAAVPVAASTSLLPLLSFVAPSPPALPAPPIGIVLVEPENQPLCRQGRCSVFEK